MNNHTPQFSQFFLEYLNTKIGMPIRHTPGPWYFYGKGPDYCLLTTNGKKSWIITSFRELDDVEQTCNATLMAASPDMLEVLLAAKKMYEEKKHAGLEPAGWQGLYEAICFAIDKAIAKNIP